MQDYIVTLTGKTPLLMHADSIEWADEMDRWKSNANKKGSRAGDDRSPAYRWLGCLYHDGTNVGVPNDNLMRALMEGSGSRSNTGTNCRRSASRWRQRNNCRVPSETKFRFPGSARHGRSRPGAAGRGMARPGAAWQGEARGCIAQLGR